MPRAIPDVILVAAEMFADERGVFRETYQRSAFVAAGITAEFVQDNTSRSMRGVLRGLHFQTGRAAQGKLVSVIRGSIFDVAVDLRPGSPTFGRSVTEVLSEANGRMLYVPAGFAHGFCVVGDGADVVYKVTAEYAPGADGGVRWDDPALGIAWPVRDPIVSRKDAALPLLADARLDGG